jgi:glycerol-3-phosphate acyltransferase PlsX
MNIAVDAMGGDYAPEVVVQGALQAADDFGVNITLVGNRETIQGYIKGHKKKDSIGVHHCDEVVSMNESPLRAVRQKKRASIRVAFDLAKQGAVDAVVSAGHSGATLAAGILTLGRIEGVERPALASVFPGERGDVILIDVGANVDCRPLHLFHFGIMAHAFVTSYIDIKDPKIGLLSIGEEGSKGNEQVRMAHDLFKESQLNFIGNVEGRDLFSGDVEIIVCDGFVGNVALKLCEGLTEVMARMLRKEMSITIAGRVGLLFGRKSFQKINKRLDYAEYGGAPILGINGVGIVCHGGSSAHAIKNAIGMASSYVENRIQERLTLKIADFQSLSQTSL